MIAPPKPDFVAERWKEKEGNKQRIKYFNLVGDSTSEFGGEEECVLGLELSDGRVTCLASHQEATW